MTIPKTPTKKEGKNNPWIAVRNGEPCEVFPSRRDAVAWFKSVLKQTLKDFENQDKTDEYDYSIEVGHLTIKPLELRWEGLGL